MSNHTLELTSDQQDLLLQGLRFVRSSVALDVQDYSPQVDAQRKHQYERISELEHLLRSIRVVKSSHV